MTCPDDEWYSILDDINAQTPMDTGVGTTGYADVDDLDKRMHAKYVLKEGVE